MLSLFLQSAVDSIDCRGIIIGNKIHKKNSMLEDTITIGRATYQFIFAGFIFFVLANSVLAAPQLRDKLVSASEPQAITVMSYNVQQLGYANWMANHFEKQRLELIPEAIQALSIRPDVLVLQEVFTEHSFTFLVKQMSEVYPYHTQVVGEDCKDSRWNSVSGNCEASLIKGNSGLLIFSRWPIEQQHAYVFDSVRVSKSFDFLARKGVVYAKIQLQRNNLKDTIEPFSLHVFGTHLQASVAEHDIRLVQLDEMRRFIDGFEIPSDQAVILAGDFNISSTDQPRFNDMLAHAAAKVTMPEVGVGSISDSTNGYRRLLAGADSEVKPELTLDYVLFRSDHLQPVINPKLQIIELKSKIPWRGVRWFKPDIELTDLSDHYPTLMQFQFY